LEPVIKRNSFKCETVLTPPASEHIIRPNQPCHFYFLLYPYFSQPKFKTGVFWRVIPYSLVGCYQRLRGTSYLHFQHTKRLFYHEGGGSMFLLNFGNHLRDYTLSHSRRSLFTIHSCEKLFSLQYLTWFLWDMLCIHFNCENISSIFYVPWKISSMCYQKCCWRKFNIIF
jgi:hypothetical protein